MDETKTTSRKPPLTRENSPLESTHELESVRAILFAREQARIQQLEERVADLAQVDEAQAEQLRSRIQELQAKIEALQNAAQNHQNQAEALQTRLDRLRADITAESEKLIPLLTSQMSGMISATIRSSRDEMAEALGPVMGEAIRVQIRDSRDDMVEALYPIILSTVQRAIAEFARELQRNIDARLKSTFGPQGLLRSITARLRGVSSSELAIREALPFAIQELFLIHHETGLLLAHLSPETQESSDRDVISGMLTAIRDFARDSFGDGSADESLDEIQYGAERIIIQSGQFVYLAAVTTGIEPEWFRARLRGFVSELHIQHAPALRDYAGDSAALPNLSPMLAGLLTDLAQPQEAEQKAMSRGQKLALAAGGLLGLLLIAGACFYLQFTIALWPLAFGTPTALPPSPSLPAATAVLQPSRTTLPPPTITPIPAATQTAEPTTTASFTPEPTATYTPAAALSPAITTAAVWVRPQPDAVNDPVAALSAGTAVGVLTQQGEWAEIEWTGSGGLQRGWIPVQWLNFTNTPGN